MTQFLLALALLAIGLFFIGVRKTLRLHSPVELKRRARAKDATAVALFPLVSYGYALHVLLWILIVFPVAGSFWLLGNVAPGFLVFITEALAIGYAFAWAPSTRVTNTAVRGAIIVAPILQWLLIHLNPVIGWAAKNVQRLRHPHHHTRLYEHEDLLDLIERQRGQSDSRIAPETLDMLAHMLRFDEKKVRDCMVPRSKAKLVAASELIGPALMQDLHESGFRRFPVYEEDNERLVGLLDLKLIIDLKHSGTVADVMSRSINYLHEDHPLEQVVDAFYKTGGHLFVVVNQREEFVGIVTIEDVLIQVFGYKIAGDFDMYDSKKAVAGYHLNDPVAGETTQP